MLHSHASLLKPNKVESAHGCCILVLHSAWDSNVRSFYQVSHLRDSFPLHWLGRPFAETPEDCDHERRRRSEPRAGRTVGTSVDFKGISYSHSLHGRPRKFCIPIHGLSMTRLGRYASGPAHAVHLQAVFTSRSERTVCVFLDGRGQDYATVFFCVRWNIRSSPRETNAERCARANYQFRDQSSRLVPECQS